MEQLIALVVRHGIPLVFLNVLLEQLGAPIPALPVLLVAGSLIREGRLSAPSILIAAVTASLIADTAWFLLGRRYGWRILRTLCRISLSPDSCVRETETFFERWGLPSLIAAKFIPGYSTVAPPLAGAIGSTAPLFIAYDAAGALLWAGGGIAVGYVFRHALFEVLRHLENLGVWGGVVGGALLALFIFLKWWQRIRFYRHLRMARIQPSDLKGMIEAGKAVVVLDVRTRSARKSDPRMIPGAMVMSASELDERMAGVTPAQEIILYCT
jgi:membrane protein DedA with SNARE-associated domain